MVYLKVAPAVLWERLRHDRTRPLLQVPNPRARIDALFREREPLYCEVADVILEGGRGGVGHMVSKLEGALALLGEQRGEPMRT